MDAPSGHGLCKGFSPLLMHGCTNMVQIIWFVNEKLLVLIWHSSEVQHLNTREGVVPYFYILMGIVHDLKILGLWQIEHLLVEKYNLGQYNGTLIYMALHGLW